MNKTPLSGYWVVEYHFLNDSFSVRALADHITEGQRVFRDRLLADSVIIEAFPNETGARDACAVWQQRRDGRPVSVEHRIAQLRRYLDGLKTQLE